MAGRKRSNSKSNHVPSNSLPTGESTNAEPKWVGDYCMLDVKCVAESTVSTEIKGLLNVD